jgi:hypothetical protein
MKKKFIHNLDECQISSMLVIKQCGGINGQTRLVNFDQMDGLDK